MSSFFHAPRTSYHSWLPILQKPNFRYLYNTSGRTNTSYIFILGRHQHSTSSRFSSAGSVSKDKLNCPTTSLRRSYSLRALLGRKTIPESKTTLEKRSTLKKWLIRIVIVGSISFIIANLDQVPETGRWRFIMSYYQRPEIGLLVKEVAHLQYLLRFQNQILPPTHPTTLQIAAILSRLLKENGKGTLNVDSGNDIDVHIERLKNISHDMDCDDPKDLIYSRDDYKNLMREWNLLIVDDDKTINAGCSYGSILVFSGLISKLHDDDGLAAVLAHEIAHYELGHATERSSVRVMTIFTVLSYICRLLPITLKSLVFGGILARYVYFLPMCRTCELEADMLGMKLTANACFDPHASLMYPTLLAPIEEIMLDDDSFTWLRKLYTFTRTHPIGPLRKKALLGTLPEAITLLQSNKNCKRIGITYEMFLHAMSVYKKDVNMHVRVQQEGIQENGGKK